MPNHASSRPRSKSLDPRGFGAKALASTLIAFSLTLGACTVSEPTPADSNENQQADVKEDTGESSSSAPPTEPTVTVPAEVEPTVTVPAEVEPTVTVPAEVEPTVTVPAEVIDQPHPADSLEPSPTPTAPTYRWYYLSDLKGHDRDLFWDSEMVTINGTPYKKSLLSNNGSGSSWGEYDLNRKCSKITGVYGLSNKSGSGATGEIEVLGDGQRLYYENFGFGKESKEDLSISNVQRIRFEMNRTSQRGSGFAFLAVGSPRVYCKF